MLTLAVGSALGRIIGIGAIPVLTRLYTPEDFGVLSVFTALVAIIAPLVTLRYALALPLPGHDGAAMNLLVLSTALMLVLTTVVTAILWMLGTHLLTLVSMEVLAPWWWLIALGVLGSASYELLSMWATRKRAYRVIAQTKVTQGIAGAIVKIGLGLAAVQPLGLLLGQVVTQAGGAGRMLHEFVGELRKNRRHVTTARLRKAAWRHRAFPFWRVPSQFLMVFSVQSPVLFMAKLYDAEITGQFGLAVMALSVPMNILGHTMSQAFLAEASNLGKRRPTEIKMMLEKVIFRLAILSIAPAVALLLFAPTVFPTVFGSDWALAGKFSQALAVYLFFQFVQAPVAHVFYIFDHQKDLFWLNGQRALALLATFGASTLFTWGAEKTVWIYSASLSAHYAISVYRAYCLIPRV